MLLPILFIGLPIGSVVAVLLLEVLIPRKKGYVYTTLDKIGVAGNFILSLVHPIMWYVTLWTALTPAMAYEKSGTNLELIIIFMGIFVPIASVAGLCLSVILRKRGYGRLSFGSQFFGMAAFLIQLSTFLVGGWIVF